MYPFRRARVLMDSDMILTKPGTDDTSLIAAYRSGDDEALTPLIQRHQAPVYRPPRRPPAPAPDGPRARPDVQAGRRWTQRQVARFLTVLPYHYRMPVVLADCLNLAAPEIAELMQISLPAVKARILRGRQRLREGIERDR